MGPLLPDGWGVRRGPEGYQLIRPDGSMLCDGMGSRDLKDLGDLLRSEFERGFRLALERAADIHPNIRVACDHEEANGSPGAACMGTVIHYRDSIRELRP